ncbi:MAG: hypothetical protein QOF02_1709 [Blastocatellia bacterium]|jgi:hypothetical protein|nr:hypothetical protein [Blastocatellia bacterium]
MDDLTEIYVYHTDKESSRAVDARHLRGNLYQIVTEKPEDEQWEFATGDKVRCMRRRFDDGTVEMMAYAKVEDDA